MRISIRLLLFSVITSTLLAVSQGYEVKTQKTSQVNSAKTSLFTKKTITSTSIKDDFAPAVFPNYFKYIQEAEALELIDKSIVSVLTA